MEFLTVNELSILRWIHILAMVYWLGGEWGVFQTSYNVTNRNLSLDERKRHMETAYRIDILARTGIVLLLPWIITVRLVSPLRQLTRWSGQVADGDLSILDISAPSNELGQLNRSFRQTVMSLQPAADRAIGA